jgi:hypothetical protein
VLTTGPAGTLQDITFTRDRKGRITAVRSGYLDSQNRPIDNWNYTYDTLERKRASLPTLRVAQRLARACFA